MCENIQLEYLNDDEKLALFGKPTKHFKKLNNIQIRDKEVSQAMNDFMKLNMKEIE